MTPEALSSRYGLLCQSTRAALNDSSLALRLAPHLGALRKLANEDLRALGRQGSPDDFADICFELAHELDHLEDFCSFPALSQKFVVAFGGGFSAGKSSLINTLLEKRLLVTEVDPTTALPTYLLAGEENAIRAKNLFGHLIKLTDEEFLTLTHDELDRYGSNISRLLQAAFITRKDFPWQNLALIDIPGYSCPEDSEHSERTDEHIARTQLNAAQAIVWVIDARQGGITEDDLKFLATLRQETPRLIVVSRADQKPEEDVEAIIAGIRQTLETRNVSFIDVVAVSSRRKEWPTTPIMEQLEYWNESRRELRLPRNFKYQFSRYERFLQDEQCYANLHLNRLNRILAISEENSVQQDARELRDKAQASFQTWKRLYDELAILRYRFFEELKFIGNMVDIPLPEPDALELLDEQDFDLVTPLQERRQNEGGSFPDVPAALIDLMMPGEISKIAAFLTSENINIFQAHFAANLDAHCRHTYVRFLAVIVCNKKKSLTELQSRLFLKILYSLGFADIREAVLGEAQSIKKNDLTEFLRIVAENNLSHNFFFDALMLSRCSKDSSLLNLQLMVELGEALALSSECISGLSILSGFVLGHHERTEYTSESVLHLTFWEPLIFRKISIKEMEKIAKSGTISGYLRHKNKKQNNSPIVCIYSDTIKNSVLLFPDSEIWTHTIQNSLIDTTGITQKFRAEAPVKIQDSIIYSSKNNSILLYGGIDDFKITESKIENPIFRPRAGSPLFWSAILLFDADTQYAKSITNHSKTLKTK